jgi:hypothetical protein
MPGRLSVQAAKIGDRIEFHSRDRTSQHRKVPVLLDVQHLSVIM